MFISKACMITLTSHLDTVKHNDPRMIDRDAFDDGLTQLLQQPFRTVPFFDEGLWGGQWMKGGLMC